MNALRNVQSEIEFCWQTRNWVEVHQNNVPETDPNLTLLCKSMLHNGNWPVVVHGCWKGHRDTLCGNVDMVVVEKGRYMVKMEGINEPIYVPIRNDGLMTVSNAISHMPFGPYAVSEIGMLKS